MQPTLSAWSQALLGVYYYGTLPSRNRTAAAAARMGRAPLMVLFYHRIADHVHNDWSMPFDVFARQMRWLKSHFPLISLAETARRVRAGHNSQAAVSITFDDGYAENCERALPLLLNEGIPFTYFVTSENVLRQRPFPHDMAAGRPLPPNTIEQLHELRDAGVAIGAHARHHVDLSQLDDIELEAEIAGSRRDLEEQLNCPVRYFSFPFGLRQHLSARAFVAARAAGYELACSAYGGYNLPGDDPFHLLRIHGDVEMIRLKNWLTCDPRKQQKR